MNLLQKLSQLAIIQLAIANLTIQKSREGDRIVILSLAEPLAHVRGSQEVEFDGKKVAIEQFDAMEVKIHEDDINLATDDFTFDDNGVTGEYKGDKLILDVSQSGDVWLRSKSFAVSGGEMRQKNQQNRASKVVEGILARQKSATAGAPNAPAGTQLVTS